MPDPFEALRQPLVPVAPDPRFVRQLRTRIVQEFDRLEAGMSLIRSSETGRAAATSARQTPIGHGDIGYVSLWVPSLKRALRFYEHVLGWSYHPAIHPGGRQIADLSMHHGLFEVSGRPTLFLCYAVDDLDEAVERVRAAGGDVIEGVGHNDGDLGPIDFVDNQGVRFALFQPDPGGSTPRPPENGLVPGDVSYVTMEVQNSALAREFYGSVLGWQFSPGRVEDEWSVEGIAPMSGLAGGQDANTVVPMYRVDDITEAVERVREAGGSATEVGSQSYGLSSECTDDQGTRFYLGQL